MNYRDIFERRGHLYNEAHEISPGARDSESACLIQWLEPQMDERIVVTAAGGGYDALRISECIAPSIAHIVCVEPSKHFSSRIPDAFHVLNTELHEIPLPDGYADAVVNLAALHHCERRREVFDEWDRILRPGGRIVIGDVEAGSDSARFLNELVAACNPGGHDGIFLESGELSDAFETRGYPRVCERLERYEWGFADRDEMVRFSRSLFGMTEASDDEIERGLDLYLGVREPGAGAPVAYPWSLRFFRADKGS